jgi:hypothetical protein
MRIVAPQLLCVPRNQAMRAVELNSIIHSATKILLMELEPAMARRTTHQHERVNALCDQQHKE